MTPANFPDELKVLETRHCLIKENKVIVLLRKESVQKHESEIFQLKNKVVILGGMSERMIETKGRIICSNT